MQNFSKETELAIKTAQEAASLIRTYRQKQNFTIKSKAKNDLVTDADIASENLIKEAISSSYPNDIIMAEESNEERLLTDERTWIIDPIDGTTNFSHGFPSYCVSIALWEQKIPQTGVVLEVANDELFAAEKAKGAYLNGEQIHLSSITNRADSLIGTGFPFRDMEVIDDYLALFKQLLYDCHGVRRPGSAAFDLCCVACGRLNGFYEYALAPWDVAAGTLIIEEAGGVICDWSGGDDWLLGKRIIAGSQPIVDFLLEAIVNHVSDEFRKPDFSG